MLPVDNKLSLKPIFDKCAVGQFKYAKYKLLYLNNQQTLIFELEFSDYIAANMFTIQSNNYNDIRFITLSCFKDHAAKIEIMLKDTVLASSKCKPISGLTKTGAPTASPTKSPSPAPTDSPTDVPTPFPTDRPIFFPTTKSPTFPPEQSIKNYSTEKFDNRHLQFSFDLSCVGMQWNSLITKRKTLSTALGMAINSFNNANPLGYIDKAWIINTEATFGRTLYQKTVQLGKQECEEFCIGFPFFAFHSTDKFCKCLDDEFAHTQLCLLRFGMITSFYYYLFFFIIYHDHLFITFYNNNKQ